VPRAKDINRRANAAWKVYVAAALLVIAVVFTFWRTTQCDFVGFDDPDVVTENPHVQQGITASNLGWMLRDYDALHYWAPVTLFTHMLDCQFFGVVAANHHRTNLLFHLVNTLLLFFLLRNLTGALWRSAFVAAFFALHPLRVESVAWIAERKDLVSAFFFLLTIWAYSAYAKSLNAQTRNSARSRLLFVLTCCGYALALMSKPMVVTLPFVLLLLDVWPLGRLTPSGLRWEPYTFKTALRLVREKVPLFVMTIPVCAITFLAQKKLGAVAPLPDVSIASRATNAFISYVGYVGETFYPHDLAALYLRPAQYPLWQAGAAVLVLVTATIFIGRCAKNSPWLLIGWLWYLGTLVPVIGFVQAGDQSMADRFTYIPSIGLCIAVVWTVAQITERIPNWRTVLILAALVLVVACSRLTAIQSGYWLNTETLFSRILALQPQSAVAHNNLGTFYHGHHQLALAIDHYEKALQITPRYAHTHYNLATIYAEQGNLDRAITHYRLAIATDPKFIDAYNDLAGALLQQHRSTEATDCLNAALKIKPDIESLRHNLANVQVMTRDITGAISNYIIATNLNPSRFENFNELGICYNLQNRFDQAIPVFTTALAMNPTNALTHCNLATAYAATSEWIRASNHYQLALDLAPSAAQIHLFFAEALIDHGYIAQAEAHLCATLRLDPTSDEAKKVLAGITLQTTDPSPAAR
jgi:protein O-mannosyl-transferase